MCMDAGNRARSFDVMCRLYLVVPAYPAHIVVHVRVGGMPRIVAAPRRGCMHCSTVYPTIGKLVLRQLQQHCSTYGGAATWLRCAGPRCHCCRRPSPPQAPQPHPGAVPAGVRDPQPPRHPAGGRGKPCAHAPRAPTAHGTPMPRAFSHGRNKQGHKYHTTPGTC